MRYYGLLVGMGLVWGAMFSITKVAVSTGHAPFGIVVWQMLIGIVLSAIAIVVSKRKFPNMFAHWQLFLGVAVLGTVAPNYFSYTATAQLPAGIISIIIALVPLFAMPIALLMGYEKPQVKRLLGAAFGAMAIVLIVGPETGLPDQSKIGYVFLAIAAPLLYAIEANFLTWSGSRGLSAVQIMFGAMVYGLFLAFPISSVFGQHISPFQPWTLPEYMIVLGALLNWIAYVGYVWLVGRTGPVFASQVAYLVTGWGVVIAMVFLGERFSLWVWLAFVLMLLGMALVRPKATK